MPRGQLEQREWRSGVSLTDLAVQVHGPPYPHGSLVHGAQPGAARRLHLRPATHILALRCADGLMAALYRMHLFTPPRSQPATCPRAWTPGLAPDSRRCRLDVRPVALARRPYPWRCVCMEHTCRNPAPQRCGLAQRLLPIVAPLTTDRGTYPVCCVSAPPPSTPLFFGHSATAWHNGCWSWRTLPARRQVRGATGHGSHTARARRAEGHGRMRG